MIPCHGSSAIVPTFLPPKSIFPSFALNHPNSTSTRMLHPRNRHVLTFASRTPTSYPHPHEATPAVLPSLPPTPPPCFAPVSASTLAILSSLCPACGCLPLIASDPRRSISVCVFSRAVHFSSSSANSRMCSFYPFAHAHFPTILIIFVWRRGSQRGKRLPVQSLALALHGTAAAHSSAPSLVVVFYSFAHIPRILRCAYSVHSHMSAPFL